MNNYTNTFGMHIICVFLKRNNIKLPKYLAYKIIDYVEKTCSEKCIICQIHYLTVKKIPFSIYQNNKKIFEFTMEPIKNSEHYGWYGEKVNITEETYDEYVKQWKHENSGTYIFGNKSRFTLSLYSNLTHGGQNMRFKHYLKKYTIHDTKRCTIPFGPYIVRSNWHPETFMNIELVNNKFTMCECIDNSPINNDYSEIGETSINCTLNEIKLKVN